MVVRLVDIKFKSQIENLHFLKYWAAKRLNPKWKANKSYLQ